MRITNIMAVSLDGRIASHEGETDAARRALSFTNADDHRHLEALLRTADAVIVGSASLLASGGAWELPNQRGAYPIWAVMTNAGLPASARFFQQTHITRWLVSRAPLTLPPTGDKARGAVRNLVYGDGQAAKALVAELESAGAERVLLFGGGAVNRLFYEAGLVDELILTVCPLIIGASAALPLVAPELERPVHLTLASSQPAGNLVFLTYNVQKT